VIQLIVDGGAGNDSFVGSALPEVFLGGDGDDRATFGDGDFFDMGAGFDALLVHGSDARDVIQFDAIRRQGREEALLVGTLGSARAVFDNGEAVTIFTEDGDDKVHVHRKAAAIWDVDIVQ
jgi:Ca2+-binding RTX toxin-like protein